MLNGIVTVVELKRFYIMLSVTVWLSNIVEKMMSRIINPMTRLCGRDYARHLRCQ